MCYVCQGKNFTNVTQKKRKDKSTTLPQTRCYVIQVNSTIAIENVDLYQTQKDMI